MAHNDMNFTRLVDWLDGRLPEPEAAALAAEVQTAINQGNADLRRTVEWIRAFRVLSDKRILAEPPPQVRAAVYDLMRRRTASAAPANFLRRIVAALVPPTGAGLVGAGTRGNASSSLRQLTYTSDIADIIINIVPQPRQSRSSLQGLVLPLATLDLNNVVVQLLRDGAEAGLTFTNEVGEFGFEALPYGSYALVLGTSQTDIEVGPLTLNA